MKYNFTDRTRKVLARAREEALTLGHDYVGTEHMLLGLLREAGGIGSRALVEMGFDVDRLRTAVLGVLRPGEGRIGPGELPYTSRGKKTLELAMAAARELSHSYVGTEHLLLGLIREEKGIAAQVLADAGVTEPDARGTILALARGEAPPEGASARAAGPGRTGRRDQVWYLEVDQDAATPLYEQIVARIEEAVATGRLEPGERLPSVRDLAAEVGIAPGTVARAYSELETRGVVRTEGARGTRVTDDPPGRTPEPDPSLLERLLRKPVVQAFHRGATAQQMREALERAMNGILKML